VTGAVAAFLIITAYLTATLSGIFGMAGGLVLMGALALVLPVAAAFATHGILQFVSNGWRAFLQRDHIRWTIVGWYALASAAAAGVVSLLAINPSKPVLFLLLGLVAMLVWLPKNWAELDAAKPLHALISGFAVTAVNLTAGVAGSSSMAGSRGARRMLCRPSGCSRWQSPHPWRAQPRAGWCWTG
jgi:uncharacterized membrane protein YfcA